MGVENIYLGVFVDMMIEQLGSENLTRLGRSARISSKLSRLRNILSMIQPLIADAAQKKIRERGAKLWLRKLQDLAYDVDDLLDDLATEAIHNTTTANKVIPISCTPIINFKYGRKMSYRLDYVTQELQSLFEYSKPFSFTLNVSETLYATPARRVYYTSNIIPPTVIVGQEGDREALMQMLLGDDVSASARQNFSVVSIIGMGGIGKTTLAQLLYNDVTVNNHFELRAWVCVSDDFDVFNIWKAIYESLGGLEKTFVNLNLLHVALSERLSNKRFLLVLDDAWNENHKWERLQHPFLVGAPGSKVIVTTRNTNVASMMGSVQTYNMGGLSDEAAMSLLAQYALDGQSFGSRPDLVVIAKDIIKKCEGSPLALKTVGNLLRRRTAVEEWERLLSSDMWHSQDVGILPALRLSYDNLHPRLKQLFAYCSLFRKDSVFHKDELVLLWMAAGFLYQRYDGHSMEGFGRHCFEELESRSFFQPLTNDKNEYTMHNLMQDLAADVGGEFFCTSDEIDDLENVRHLSFIPEQFGAYSKFKTLLKAKRLQTLLAVSAHPDGREKLFLSNKVLTEIIPQLHFLRVLNLSNYSITEIPRSIGSLKHIRYLNFSRTDITSLPEQVGDLYHLQSLLLSGCEKLFSLPKSLVKLSNLRHLDISDTPRLDKILLRTGVLKDLQALTKVNVEETGVLTDLQTVTTVNVEETGVLTDLQTPNKVNVEETGVLTDLQTPNKVNVEEIGGLDIFDDLTDLLDLQGRLCIKGLHNVNNARKAMEANLQQKKGLDDVELEWNDDFDDSAKRIAADYKVLEGLIPHHELRNLKILFYGGVEFPSWVGDSSFVCLTELTLRGCRSCSRLPTLGHLKSLQKLFVEGMNGVKNVGSELLGPADSLNDSAFPALQVLEFKDMQGWERWSTCSGDNSGSATTWFPSLGELSIVNCPKLDVVSVQSMQSLGVLRIKRCPKAVLESMVCVSSSIARLMLENIKGLTGLDVQVLEHLGAVEYLSIKQCDELKNLWDTESEECKNLVRLSKLEVEYCKMLVALESKEGHLISILPSVKHMDLHNCESLRRFKCPNGIEKLVIWDCPSFTSLAFPTVEEELRSSLNILDIRRCDNLEESWLGSNFLKSLDYLELGRLPNLRPMHEGCFSQLTRLILRGCDHIESITERDLDFVHLRTLEIISCMDLKSIPHEHLGGLASLEELWISNCPSLDLFPCGLWPPNLRALTIGGLKKPMSKWGQQIFPASLDTLYLHGENSGVVSFATSSSDFVLPPSLSFLEINGFMHLKSVSEGLQDLTCLKGLVIDSCPKLGDLPVARLSKLLSLKVYNCLKLQERCQSKSGKYRNIISKIPELYI